MKKINKKNLLTILCLLFPLLFAIGFSSWIIIYEHVFSPSYVQGNKISEAFGYSQNVYYNGQIQYPKIKDGYELDITSLSYKYKLQTDQDFIDVEPTDVELIGPIDAGVYDVIIIANGEDSGQCQVKFTINKMKLNLLNTELELDYDSKNLSFTDFASTISKQIVINNQDNELQNDITHKNGYTIPYIHNGIYYYGEYSDKSLIDNTTTEYVFGSTYTSTIKLVDSLAKNYEFSKTPVFTIKYKTVKVTGQSSLFTIEDALNTSSGNISLLGNSSGAQTYITSSFSKLSSSEGNPYKTNTYNLSNRNLIVPYEETGKTYDRDEKEKGNVYSVLIISDNITLNFNSESNLIAAAFVGFKQPKTTISCERGVIINNGIINIETGCNVYSYGYIKGQGIINLKNGSTATDCMTTYDWPGGSASMGMYSDVMPTNAWSLHNISCTTNVYAGAQYKGYFIVKLSIVGIVDTTANIIGKSTDTNCVFKVTSGYLRKSVNKAKSWSDDNENFTSLYTITGSNQLCGQRDVIELFGDCQDGKLQMKVGSGLFGVTLQSSTDIPLPVSFMDIFIKSNSNMNISNSDYLLLPGASLVIESNSIVNIGSSVDISITKWSDFSSYTAETYSFAAKCVDKIDAHFEVNGSLIITNGSIGGKIITNKSGAILNLSNCSTTSTYKSLRSPTEGSYYFENSINAKGNVNSIEDNSFDNISYISTLQSGIYTWVPATDITTFTMMFYDADKTTLLEEMDVQVINDTKYTVCGNEYIPSKRFYNFDKWLDLNGNEIIGETFTDNTIPIKLYATWTIKEYNFLYFLEYNEESVMSDVQFENKVDTFTINDFVNEKFTIDTKVSYFDKNFNGWYLGVNSEGVKTNILTTEILNKYLDEVGDNESSIPLYGYFSDTKKYTISFVDNQNDNENFADIEIFDDDNLSLYTIEDFTKNYNEDTGERFYFQGWYTSSGNMISNRENIKYYIENNYILQNDIIDGKITLYAKFVEKDFYVKYYNDENSTIEVVEYRQYFNKGQSFTLQKSITKDDEDTTYLTKYIFSKWIINNSNYDPGYNYNNASSNINVYAKFNKEEWARITFECSNASVALTSDEYNAFKSSYANGDIELVPLNTSITFTPSYTQSSNKSITIDGNTFTNPYLVSKHIKVVAKSSTSCISAGTLVNMADGTTKKVEDLIIGDMLIVFNHEEGKYDVSPMMFNAHAQMSWGEYEVIKLLFSDGTILKIINEHTLFDTTLNKYVVIDKESVNEYVNHKFYGTDILGGEFFRKDVELLSFSVYTEFTGVYNPLTYYHMNCFTEGLLSMPGEIQDLINIFEYDYNLKYDEEYYNEQVEKYGLFTYEEVSQYFTVEIFNALPLSYCKVAIGKGMTTWEEIYKLISKYDKDIEDYS